MSAECVLAADVGGTRTTAVLAVVDNPWPRVLELATYSSQSYQSLGGIFAEFLARPAVHGQRAALRSACFAVAGPVSENSTTLTNLGWTVRGDQLALELGLPEVRLINDFAAAGLGIPRLAADEFETLQAGRPVARGARLVIGAGTGLGTAYLTWHEGRYVAHASEGGHADFAPVDDIQDRLLGYLRRTFGRVSYERVVSGPGLMRIFSFLQEAGAGLPSKALQEAAKDEPDTAAVIGEFALARLDPLAMRALDLFAATYGAFAGNLALATLAHGGVYIAGGIAPKIAAKLKDGVFIHAFNAKGRFGDLLETIPVRIVMNARVGLYGALLEAQRQVSGNGPGPYPDS
jgi:glucokinase